MKISTLLVAVCSALVLSGCGYIDRKFASLTGSAESCVDGVKYIQFASGVTVKYAPDGGIVRCDGSSSAAAKSALSSSAVSTIQTIPR